MNAEREAVVVGSGPNGFSAAITLLKNGIAVRMYEAKDSPGGGVRSGNLTLPGFAHDICSSVYPFATLSPFFSSLPMEALGLRLIQPRFAAAHPFDGGSCAALAGRGEPISVPDAADALRWQKLFSPWAKRGAAIFCDMLAPFSLLPKHPLAMARLGWKGMPSAEHAAKSHFRSMEAQALFAGIAAHSLLPLGRPCSAATALVLGLAAEIDGWPFAAGGAGALTAALLRHFSDLGGLLELNSPISSLSQIPRAKLVLLDISARQFAAMCERELPGWYLERLRKMRAGPGICKVDWALSEAVPWSAPECRAAGTLHLGGSFEEIALSELEVAQGRVPENPFVLAAQPSCFDPQRGPPGQHVLWAYSHVPYGCPVNISARIEKQIERFAPGFRDVVLARHVTMPAELAARNPNMDGGDISGGAMDWPQIFRRPATWFGPYRTPIAGVYLCSASTPPGPGVHGMCGYHAAMLALRDLRHGSR